MLDYILFKEEENLKLFHIFGFVIILSFVVLYITQHYIKFEIGMISTFLVTLAISYPVVKFLKREEKSEEVKKRLKETKLIERHSRELLIYLTIFVAVTVAFICYASIFDVNVFDAQIETVKNINPGMISGNIFNVDHFTTILYNNLGVFFLTFLLSLIISGGMVFIIIWNASVLGVFLVSITQDIFRANVAIFSYLPHGLLEIGGYVFAGIAASLLSHQVDNYLVKEHYKQGVFDRVILDVLVITGIGLGFIFLGAFVEVL